MLVGRCPAYGRGITYRALAEVLGQHLHGVETEPDRVLRELDDGDILRLTFGLDAPGDLHPLVARGRLEAAWVRLLAGLSGTQAVVLLIEDLHWAEDLSSTCSSASWTSCRAGSWCCARHGLELLEHRPGWAERPSGATCVRLEPLAGEETERDRRRAPRIAPPRLAARAHHVVGGG